MELPAASVAAGAALPDVVMLADEEELPVAAAMEVAVDEADAPVVEAAVLEPLPVAPPAVMVMAIGIRSDAARVSVVVFTGSEVPDWTESVREGGLAVACLKGVGR